MSNSKKISINHRFTLENGQSIEVEELIITPVSPQLVYKMQNIHDDVYYRILDEHGEEVQEIGRQYSGDENYNRFKAVESSKIKIIPVVSAMEHSQEYILTNEIFEHELDGE